MKKLLRHLSLLFILSTSFACKKEDKKPEDNAQSFSIVGNWKATIISDKDYENGKLTRSDSAVFSFPHFKKFNEDGSGSASDEFRVTEIFNYARTGTSLKFTNYTVIDANPPYTKTRINDKVFTIRKLNATTLGLYWDRPFVENGINKVYQQTIYYTKQ